MFIHDFAHFITKMTAVPVELLFFKRRTYYEDKKQKTRHAKGGVLYVSNHKSFWDYLCFFFLVYFHRLRPVVSTLIYRKNPVLRFLLNMCGCIVVGENAFDVAYIDTCVSLLRKGKKIVIFPEAHFIKTDKIQPFSPSFAKIAILADTPIVPLYTDGRYGLFKRTHVVMGRRIYPGRVCKDDSAEEVNKLAALVQKKVEYLQTVCKRSSKGHVISFREFPMDFGRLFFAAHVYWFLRPSYHAVGETKSPQAMHRPMIIACNHRGFGDAPSLIICFWRRRLYFLAAQEVFGKPGTHRIRKKLLKDIGGIRIDRDILDIEAINRCCGILERGRTLVVFPEGHLTHTSDVSPLKMGTAMISSKTGVPILPLYLCASKGFFHKKHYYVGDPIYPQGKSMADIKRESDQVFESMKHLREVALQEGYEHD